MFQVDFYSMIIPTWLHKKERDKDRNHIQPGSKAFPIATATLSFNSYANKNAFQ